MAFYYHKAHSLGVLFPELYRLIKEERKTLRPQTPQTIIVGSLDVEAWIEEKFIEHDGVLMGVHFPFLETALETFAERQTAAIFPGAHESWFSVIPGLKRAKKAGMLQLELAVLNLLMAAREENPAVIFEYDIQNLGPLQLLTLAQRIAREIREYLLHAPDAMEKFLRGKPTAAIGKIWKVVNAELRQAGYVSGMFSGNRDAKEKAEEPSLFSTAQGGGSLYLFGMPVLSAYHIRKLCAVARTVDVHLLGVHPETGSRIHNDYYFSVAKIYAAYAAFLAKTAKSLDTQFSEISHSSNFSAWQKAWLEDKAMDAPVQSPVSFLGLPGLWRGAEIIADLWHQEMRNDAAIRQDDFSLMLTDPAGQFPAFDKACGSRRLAVFARNRLFERPHSIVELISVLASASGDGVNRDLLVRYFSNAVVCERFRLDSEKTNLYIRALTEANGFRNDYPGALGIFNLTAALDRIRRALLIDPPTAVGDGIPGATYIRSLDTAETLSEFLSCLEILTQVSVILKPQPGAELVRQLIAFLHKFQSEPSPEFNAIAEALTEIAALIPNHNLSLQQVARMLIRNIPGKNLSQSAQRQGICASPLSSPAPFRRSVTLCDMNEELDAAPENEEGMLPEYLISPTRLKKTDQVAIHLVHAALSETAALQICYSRFDPKTGAEKYRSVEVERFKASLAARKIIFAETDGFPQTIFDAAPGFAPNAADADVRTVRLSYTKAVAELNLAQALLPALQVKEPAADLTVKNLIDYVQKPFQFFYGRITTLPEDPADFRFGEPKLAESKSFKFRFAENYLKQAVLAPRAIPLDNPLSLFAAEQLKGIAEPEGFDFMHRLLSSGNNERILIAAAEAAQNRFHIIEYLFDTRIKTAFSVKEGERLTRRYLPAPKIGSVTITGSTDKFLVTAEDSYLYLAGSFKDGDRTKHCVGAYLQLAVILTATANFPEQAPAGIKLMQYEIKISDAEKSAVEISSAIKFSLDAEKISGGDAYLNGIAEAIASQGAPYFDLKLLGINKLGGFAEKSDAEILDALTKTLTSGDSPDFLADFYQPGLNDDSVAFFNQFIRPIAETDVTAAKPKTGRKK